jgi:hypothetical protein
MRYDVGPVYGFKFYTEDVAPPGDEMIYRAAIRYLLIQIRDKTDRSKLSQEINVTPWLERG